jgi:hypothetical protein
MLAFLFLATAALANPLCPLNESKLRAALTPAFRKQMKPLVAGVKSLEERLGKCVGTSGAEPNFALRFESGEVDTHVKLSKKGQWESVAFGLPEYPEDSAEKIRLAAGKLGAALFAAQGSTSFISVRAEEKSSVGEMVYLLALARYRAKEKAGELKATDVVVLPENATAFSPGPLSRWPAGVPITLEAAAQLAFRSRDNIAGDLLLRKIAPQEWFAYADMNRMLLLPRAEAEAIWAAGPPLKKSLPSEDPAAPLSKTNGMEDKIGWFTPVKEICSAASAVKGDAVFVGQEEPGAPDEINGAFPGTVAYARFGEVGGRWVCAAIAMPRRTEDSYTWGRDLLERAFLLAAKEGAFPGKEGQKTGR